MPLAQSSELPPPKPMIESMLSGAANSLPASTISVSGLDFEIMKAKDFDACLLQRGQRLVDVTRCNHAVVGDEQRTAKTQLSGELAETFDGAGAKDHPRSRLKVERLHSIRNSGLALGRLLGVRRLVGALARGGLAPLRSRQRCIIQATRIRLLNLIKEAAPGRRGPKRRRAAALQGDVRLSPTSVCCAPSSTSRRPQASPAQLPPARRADCGLK